MKAKLKLGQLRTSYKYNRETKKSNIQLEKLVKDQNCLIMDYIQFISNEEFLSTMAQVYYAIYLSRHAANVEFDTSCWCNTLEVKAANDELCDRRFLQLNESGLYSIPKVYALKHLDGNVPTTITFTISRLD